MNFPAFFFTQIYSRRFTDSFSVDTLYCVGLESLRSEVRAAS